MTIPPTDQSMQRRGPDYADGQATFRPLLVTKQQAARLLSVSVRTVENLLAQKQLTFRKFGKRTLIPYSAVAQLARHDVPVISGQRLAS